MSVITRSIPTANVEAWIAAGASYVGPDFDRANYSLVRFTPDFDRANYSLVRFTDATAALNATLQYWLNEREANNLAAAVASLNNELAVLP